VRVPSQGAVLAGTLSIPPGPGPYQGIVILPGSGALDRHFESISQEIYLSLGFEVLAFDKRGVAGSTGVFPGELATPEVIGIQATDAAAAARFVMAQPGVDARQVGFDANSQGGWVAPLAAKATTPRPRWRPCTSRRSGSTASWTGRSRSGSAWRTSPHTATRTGP
jgi:uncharacterized protein